MTRIAVVGSGVAGLAAVYHLLELWKAHPGDDPLHVTLYAPLVPHAGSDGSGLGGKAMSRHFEGYTDLKHGMPRHPFYGPAMPWRGTIPHGYHILWQYPNLRRMLGDDGDGMGLLRPPGGARVIASFQGMVDQPTPGGPGIGLMGLCDPDEGLAFRRETQVLFRLRDTPLVDRFVVSLRSLVGDSDIDPLSFSDLFFAHEVDIELRLALIFASVQARTLNPEQELIDGVPLTEVEYDRWAERMVTKWAVVATPVLDPLAKLAREVRNVAALVEEELEADEAPPTDELGWLAFQIERVVREIPAGLATLAAGRYPIWRTLHFRFAPDATFTSPYSYDAAQAVRSLAFCFSSPKASRMWTPDGGQIQRLWLRLWERIRAAAQDPRITLEEIEGRVDEIEVDGGSLTISAGPYSGHTGDLGMPWAPTVHHRMPTPETLFPPQKFDAVVPTCAAGALEGILSGPAFLDAKGTLAKLSRLGNETLEILVWTREPIQWSEVARAGLREAAITGLDGPFCLVADYRCGLWSEERLAEERPFGPEVPFVGSILESCGGFDELYACSTREDSWGWPRETKEAIRDLLSKPEFFDEVDARKWSFDRVEWGAERASGSWKPSRALDPASGDDWFVACRWFAWGWLRQMSMIQSLGEQAVRQLADYAALLDPRGRTREEILAPQFLDRVRFVVMRNAKARNRIFSPGVGSWHKRPFSGQPLGHPRLFPAGDWTRNGLDIVCMEAAALSAMRASRAAYAAVTGKAPGVEGPIPVLPPASWYT